MRRYLFVLGRLRIHVFGRLRPSRCTRVVHKQSAPRRRFARTRWLALLLQAALLLVSAMAPTLEAFADELTSDRVIELLVERALAQSADAHEVLVVARCETGFTFNPWRDDGSLRRGRLGEVGLGQWLPPVERNHWGRTPHWKESGYHIEIAYEIGDPAAIWWDADALAWAMGPGAPLGFKRGWTCWRIRGWWWEW